jgi:hypothetical protein
MSERVDKETMLRWLARYWEFGAGRPGNRLPGRVRHKTGASGWPPEDLDALYLEWAASPEVAPHVDPEKEVEL